MCAKVNNSNGCYRETQSTGMQVEACVCTSKLGLIPCNCSPTTQSQQILGWVIVLLSAFIVLK